MPGIVFTDLDGTLLSHDGYQFESVLPMLAELKAAQIPVVLSTSKTFPEVIVWRNQLGLADDPFMVENGSAIYFPEESVNKVHLEEFVFNLADGFYEVVLGTPLSTLQQFLAPYEGKLVNFVNCSVEQAMDLTGLSKSEAQLARQRCYSVPLVIDDEEVKAHLVQSANAEGLHCQQGGRFLHLQGACNKGDALNIIKRVRDQQLGINHLTLALGDSDNDRMMLETADIAVVVRSHQHLDLVRTHVYYTQKVAPEGWSEGVGTALAQLKG